MKQLEFVVVGLSHHTAPVEVREPLSVATEAVATEAASLVGSLPFDEAVVLSTCNRVEVYGVTSDPAAALRGARARLMERAAPRDLGPHLYERVSADAIRHAFRVTASLDSMVLGEPQILGQVKGALAAAEAVGTVGSLLGQCFRHAFAAAKRVRSETEIAAGSVSVSSIAIELASKIFGSLEGRRVLLVGAGKMGEAAAKALRKRGAELTVLNRSPEKAEALARAAEGKARPYEALAEELGHADVVITSTGSPTFILGESVVRGVMRARRGRPLFLIDIAVPRDIDPRVGDLENVFLYDVDDLRKVADENLSARRREAEKAERIVAEEAQSFERWRSSLALTPTIVALREHFLRIAQAEVERSAPRQGAEETRAAVEAAVGRVVQKLLHAPLTELKRAEDPAEAARLVAAVRRLYGLEGTPSLAPRKADPVRSEAPAALPATPSRGRKP